MPSHSRCHGESVRGTAVPHRQPGVRRMGRPPASERRGEKEAIKSGRGSGAAARNGAGRPRYERQASRWGGEWRRMRRSECWLCTTL